jgi:hypothetical protein
LPNSLRPWATIQTLPRPITNGLAGKLAVDANLSDLADPAAARSNFGLGSMAPQAADNVAITGGSIDGITLDDGTF